MPSKARRLYGFAIALAILWFGFAFTLEARKNPLRGDEVDFFGCIANQRDHGRVLNYAGEVHYDRKSLIPVGRDHLGETPLEIFDFDPSAHILKGARFALDGTSRYTYCLWHPPLYVATAALAAHALPLDPARGWLLRFSHLPFLLLLGAACFWCASELYPERRGRVTLGALGLLAIDSLWIRGTILLDYAGTTAPIAALVVVVGVARLRRGSSLVALLALTVPWFASFGASVAMLVAAFAAALAARDLRYVARLAVHAVAGFFLFSVVFYVWSTLNGFPFAEPYVYNFLFRGGNSHGVKVWRSIVIFFRYAFQSGVVLSVLFATLAVLGLRKPDAFKQPALVLVTSVLVAFGMHAWLRVDAYGFSKYILYALPLMALFVAGELSSLLATGDGRSRQLATVALALACVEGLGRSAATLADPAPDLYLAGQTGVLEAGALLRERSSPNDVLLAHKDVAFYTNRKFISFMGPVLHDGALLTRELDRHHVRLFGIWTGGIAAAKPDVQALIKQRFPRTLLATDSFQVFAAE